MEDKNMNQEEELISEKESETEEMVSEENSDQESEQQETARWKKFFFIYPHITRSSYILRAVAGGYIGYLAVNNLMSLSATESGEPLIIGLLSLFLLICGAYFLFSGVYALIKQEYQ